MDIDRIAAQNPTVSISDFDFIDSDEAVTWVYLDDVETGERHMLEFDGEHHESDAADLVIRDYSDLWPSPDTFQIVSVEPGEPDQ